MVERQTGHQLISNAMVVMTLILLSGVIIMAYGFFEGKSVMMYSGLGITVISSFNLIVRSAVAHSSSK
jgi:hypothetical protein